MHTVQAKASLLLWKCAIQAPANIQWKNHFPQTLAQNEMHTIYNGDCDHLHRVNLSTRFVKVGSNFASAASETYVPARAQTRGATPHPLSR